LLRAIPFQTDPTRGRNDIQDNDTPINDALRRASFNLSDVGPSGTFFIAMLSVIMLSVVMLSVVLSNFVGPGANVIKFYLSVIYGFSY
jgi:hypothetical protein